MKQKWLIRAWNIPYMSPITKTFQAKKHVYVKRTKLSAILCVIRCRLLFDYVEVVPLGGG